MDHRLRLDAPPVRSPAALGAASGSGAETAAPVVRMSSLCSARSDPQKERDRDTMINITSDISNVRPVSVAFVNCHDATTFGRTVHMTAHEERRLRGLLEALRGAGIILRASFEPALPGYGFSDVVDHLRGSVGAHLVGTGLA